MKISIFVPSFETGGVENNVILYSKILVENSIETELTYVRAVEKKLSKVDKKVKKIKIGKKINIPFIHPRVLDSLSLIWDYYKYLKNNEVLIFSFQNSVVAIILAKLARRKIIIRVANHPNSAKIEKSFTVKLSNFLKKVIYKYANLIITNSEVTTQALKQITKNNNVKTIYNPSYSLDLISKSKEDIMDEKFNNIIGSKIIAVGRLVKQKDFKTLIKAFKIVKEKLKDSNLIIIGEGSERKNLENLVKGLKLSDVYFLGYKSNPYKYVAKCDLFVLSSLYEGLPNVLIEAIAVGTPVVSTNCLSGPSEILLDGRGGDLVEVGNYENLAKCIIKNLEDRDYAISKWKVAYDNLDRFSYDNIKNKLLEVIKNV